MKLRRWLLAPCIVAFAVAWATVGFPSQHFKPGSAAARWPIKTRLPDGADPDKPKKAVKLDDLLKFGLPEVATPIKSHDARFTYQRIPHYANDLSHIIGTAKETRCGRRRGWRRGRRYASGRTKSPSMTAVDVALLRRSSSQPDGRITSAAA